MKLPWLLISLGMAKLGSRSAAGRAEAIETVGFDRDLQRALRIVAPVRQEPVEPDRIDDRAGENMGADFGAFLDDDDAGVRRQLLQADRRGEPRRPGADDDDVVIHRLARRQIVFHFTLGHHSLLPPIGLARATF